MERVTAHLRALQNSNTPTCPIHPLRRKAWGAMALAAAMVLVAFSVPSLGAPIHVSPAATTVTPNPALVENQLTVSGTVTGTYASGDAIGGTITFSNGAPTLTFCPPPAPPSLDAGTCTLSATGTYDLVFHLWYASRGTATVNIRDTALGETGTDTGTFAVDSNLSLSSYMGAYNSALTLLGNGLDAGGGIRINGCTWSGAGIAGCYNGASTTTADANYTVSVPVPAAPYGHHVVSLSDSGGAGATSNFFETASDTLTPNAGVIGTTVTVAGGGFSADAPFEVIWNSGTSGAYVIASGTTTGAGSIPGGTTFKVPFNVGGPLNVEVLDGNGVSSTTAFTVDDQLFASTPATGPVGTGFTVTGNGFLSGGVVTTEWDPGGDADHVVFGTPSAAANGTFAYAGHTPPSPDGGHDIIVVPTGGPNDAFTTFTTTPSLNLTPMAGPAGSSVSSSLAQGLSATVDAYLIWDPGLATQQILFAPGMLTNGDGSITFPAWTVPATAVPGPHTVEVEDANDVTAMATFYVGPWLTLTPTTGPANTTITAQGWAFGVGTLVSLFWNGVAAPLTTVGPISAASGGLLGNFTATIPAVASPAGAHNVWANATGISTAAAFTISPSLAASVLKGPVGTVALLKVQGMAAQSLVSVLWGGTNVASSQLSNAVGSTVIPFTVPAATAGSHTLQAKDAAGDSSNTRSFVVTPSIVAATLSAYEGTNVSVQAYGFAGTSTVVLMFDGSPVAGTGVASSALGSAALTFPVPFTPGAGTLSASDASFDNASAYPFTVWALAVPVPISPVAGTEVNTSSVSLVWDPVSQHNATYAVEVSTSPTFGSGTLEVLAGTSTAASVGPLADGTWYWHVEAVSASGGTAGWSPTETFVVDVTALTLSVSGPHGTSYWYTGAVTVAATTTAGAGGLEGTFVAVNAGGYARYNGPIAINTNGWNTVSAYAITDSGFITAPVTIQVAIDGVVPSTSSNVDAAAGYWYNATNSPVSVTLASMGGPSGIQGTYWSLDSSAWTNSTGFVVGGNGVHTLEFYAVSGAGLAGAVQTQLVRVDVLPPTSSATLTGNLTASGWYATATTLTLSASDSVSGVAASYYLNATPGSAPPTSAEVWHLYSAPLVYTTGSYLVWFRSVNHAGNWEVPKEVVFNVDMADTQAPGFAALLTSVPTWTGTITYSIELTDPAGFTAAWLQIDDGAQLLMSPSSPSPGATSVEFELSVDTTSLENGEHVVTVTAENALGQRTVFGPEHVNVNNIDYGPYALVIGLVVLLLIGLVAFWGTGYRRRTKGKKQGEPMPPAAQTSAPSPVAPTPKPAEEPSSSDTLTASVPEESPSSADVVAPNANESAGPSGGGRSNLGEGWSAPAQDPPPPPGDLGHASPSSGEEGT